MQGTLPPAPNLCSSSSVMRTNPAAPEPSGSRCPRQGAKQHRGMHPGPVLLPWERGGGGVGAAATPSPRRLPSSIPARPSEVVGGGGGVGVGEGAGPRAIAAGHLGRERGGASEAELSPLLSPHPGGGPSPRASRTARCSAPLPLGGRPLWPWPPWAPRAPAGTQSPRGHPEPPPSRRAQELAEEPKRPRPCSSPLAR